MKRVRRYAAWAVYIAVWLAFLPVAFAHALIEAVMTRVCSVLDGLEGIIHE
jgi:hypothetical protein